MKKHSPLSHLCEWGQWVDTVGGADAASSSSTVQHHFVKIVESGSTFAAMQCDVMWQGAVLASMHMQVHVSGGLLWNMNTIFLLFFVIVVMKDIKVAKSCL